MEVSGQLHAPTALLPRKEPSVLNVHCTQRLYDAEKRNNLYFRDSNAGRPAHSSSLYRSGLTKQRWLIVVVLRADSPGKAAQWFAESIPES
jgi:hypothetical protein